ncbi:MAG: alpha/beta hydrolase [Legionella sp.]|nr:alpha/beta hydrolase [Legionella sp.]
MKNIIHFAHGNGFPALSYRQLLQQLEIEYPCFYIERIGHDNRFPVTDNWTALVQELINNVETHVDESVIAVGHSMGGILSLLASIQRPDLFKQVIMIDAPLLGWMKSAMVYMAKKTGWIDRLTPALRAKTRRIHWQNKNQIRNYLQKRELFQTFSAECLEDYIENGFQKTSKGYSLFFDREIEYFIYRTMPHTLYKFCGPLSVPTTLIYGNQSNVIRGCDLRYMRKYYQIATIELPGTHMLPMEDPSGLAESILQILR